MHGVQRVEIIEPTQNMAISEYRRRAVSHSPLAKVGVMSNYCYRHQPAISCIAPKLSERAYRHSGRPQHAVVAGHLPGASLPYLAWAFSVDRWDRNWPEGQSDR